MIEKLNGITVWPGVIGSDRSDSLTGLLISLRIGGEYCKLTGDVRGNCPSHTFIIVEHDGQLWIGESVRPKSQWTPFAEYERRLAAGEIRNFQLFEVHDISRLRQGVAAEWWNDNIHNEFYDVPILDNPFKHWCTEGVADAYAQGAAYDILDDRFPTPVTPIRKWKEGRLKLLENT